MAERASRRAVLAAAAALPVLAAGCKGIGALVPPPHPGPQVIMLDHAIRAEELLIARYHAALARFPGPASPGATLAAVLAEHADHLSQLRSRLILPPRLARTRPARRPPPPLPAGRPAVLASLAAAERDASARLLRQLLGAPPPLAQLMASIAASEAAHTVVLAGAGRG